MQRFSKDLSVETDDAFKFQAIVIVSVAPGLFSFLIFKFVIQLKLIMKLKNRSICLFKVNTM